MRLTIAAWLLALTTGCDRSDTLAASCEHGAAAAYVGGRCTCDGGTGGGVLGGPQVVPMLPL